MVETLTSCARGLPRALTLLQFDCIVHSYSLYAFQCKCAKLHFTYNSFQCAHETSDGVSIAQQQRTLACRGELEN